MLRLLLIIVSAWAWTSGAVAQTASPTTPSIESKKWLEMAAVDKVPPSSAKRELLIKATREGLRSETDWKIAAAKLAAVSNLTETIPDLKASIKETPEWQLVAALAKLSDQVGGKEKLDTEALVLESFGRWSAASKVAGVSALSKTKVSDVYFNSWLNDANSTVRLIAARQFFSTRSLYSTDEQVARLRTLFQTKPYQVRLEAMETYARFDAKERVKLAKSIDPAICAAESREDVKAVCVKITGAKP